MNADDEDDEEFKDAFDCFDDPAGANEWTDAKDFFSGATPTKSRMFANVMQVKNTSDGLSLRNTLAIDRS